jgi:hypothetical protein
MSRSIHDKVVRILYELCKSNKEYSNVYADHIAENYQPIIIVPSTKKTQEVATLKYNPDIWAECKNSKIDVFEVWDKETENECIADMVLFALTKNNRYLHIVCFDEEHKKLAEKLDKIILDTVCNEGGKYLSTYKIFIALIPEKLFKNKKKLKNYLRKTLKETV